MSDMDLNVHYNELYNASREKILADDYEIDALINSSSDNRYGLTLLLRPDDHVKDNIRKFLNELRQIEPVQYYYPDSDIHITVMSVISCYSTFDLANISIPDYVELINKTLHNMRQIRITFSGITASPSCILIQGFPLDDTLKEFRNNLRMNFQGSELEQTIDKRYAIQTAHATVVRFQKRFSRKDEFLRTIEKYRNYSFGTSVIDSVEFVYNDWYQRKKFVQVLHKFDLVN